MYMFLGTKVLRCSGEIFCLVEEFHAWAEAPWALSLNRPHCSCHDPAVTLITSHFPLHIFPPTNYALLMASEAFLIRPVTLFNLNPAESHRSLPFQTCPSCPLQNKLPPAVWVRIKKECLFPHENDTFEHRHCLNCRWCVYWSVQRFLFQWQPCQINITLSVSACSLISPWKSNNPWSYILLLL